MEAEKVEADADRKFSRASRSSHVCEDDAIPKKRAAAVDLSGGPTVSPEFVQQLEAEMDWIN